MQEYSWYYLSVFMLITLFTNYLKLMKIKIYNLNEPSYEYKKSLSTFRFNN